MAVPRSPYAPRSLRQLSLATIAASLLAVLAGPAQAQSSVFDDLLERLKEKGVLSQDEYDALKAARDEENMEQRAERRRQALREAQEAEKQEKAKEEAKTTLKSGVRQRLRVRDRRQREPLAVQRPGPGRLPYIQ
jgi:hypothetical protein